MSEILSIEIIFYSGPTMKVFSDEIYDFMIDSVPVAEMKFSSMQTQPQKCKSVSFKVKECENRKIWSFENKATIKYFEWILSSGHVKKIKFNIQNYQKRIFLVPWKEGPMNSNAYQCSEILDNGDLSIRIMDSN